MHAARGRTESAADPCAALGAPSGWSCLAIADPRDGECRDPQRGMHEDLHVTSTSSTALDVAPREARIVT
ncbi:MAG TPA: hypothetical protein VF316_13320, partial [Polyangiaceae bacterium]